MVHVSMAFDENLNVQCSDDFQAQIKKKIPGYLNSWNNLLLVILSIISIRMLILTEQKLKYWALFAYKKHSIVLFTSEMSHPYSLEVKI